MHFGNAFDRSYPTLYDVLDISPFVVATIGVYDSSSSLWLHDLQPLKSNAKKSGRYRRQQKQCEAATDFFRVTTMIEPPFVIWDPNRTIAPGETHKDHYAGIVIDIMEEISKSLRFEYAMHLPKDLKYGSIDEDGVGNGMVGELMRCESDLAAAAFATTFSRSKYIHFTKPYIDAGKTLLVYKGEVTSFDVWAFLDPFDFFTKLVIVGCFVAVSFVYIILEKVSSCRQTLDLEENEHRDGRSERLAYSNPVWLLYTTAMQQGPDYVSSLSGKIIVAGWFFFCLVIVATYTANLAAFLTVRSFADGLHSLDDLAKQTEVIYGTVKNTSISDYFKNSPINVHRQMYEFMASTEGALVDTAAEAYDRVESQSKGPYVFIWDEPILQYRTSHRPCKSKVVGRTFHFQGYALALPRNMPYQRNFSLVVLKLRDSGKIEELREKWLKAGDCDVTVQEKDVTNAEEVHFSDLIGVFIILGTAVALSLAVAVVEHLRWKRQRRATVNVSSNMDGQISSTRNVHDAWRE